MEWMCNCVYLVNWVGPAGVIDAQSCWTPSIDIHGLSVQQNTFLSQGRWVDKWQFPEIAVREGYLQAACRCATFARILRGSSENAGNWSTRSSLIRPHRRMHINMRVSFCVGVEHSPGFILVRIHEKNLTNLKAPPFCSHFSHNSLSQNAYLFPCTISFCGVDSTGKSWPS